MHPFTHIHAGNPCAARVQAGELPFRGQIKWIFIGMEKLGIEPPTSGAYAAVYMCHWPE